MTAHLNSAELMLIDMIKAEYQASLEYVDRQWDIQVLIHRLTKDDPEVNPANIIAELTADEQVYYRKRLQEQTNGPVSKKQMDHVLEGDPEGRQYYRSLIDEAKMWRGQGTEARNVLRKYLSMLSTADMLYGSYNAISGRRYAGKTKAKVSSSAADRWYERALEHLGELIEGDKAIEVYLDRSLTTEREIIEGRCRGHEREGHKSIDLSPEGMPRLRDEYKSAMTRDDIKLATLKSCLERSLQCVDDLSNGKAESTDKERELVDLKNLTSLMRR